MADVELIAGGVTSPRGFQAAGVHADVKGKGGAKKDVALIHSTVPASAAAVFTTNAVKAAPVLVSQQRVQAGTLRTIVVNSGNANACTGAQGMQDAETMTAVAAESLGFSPAQVAVASTGVIGVPMPMDRISQGIVAAVAALSPEGGHDAALAIMTTDTVHKEIATRVTLGGKTVTIGGTAKGSGMIHPNMATMLGFVTTDAAVAPEALRQALQAANAASFNMITVDGDTSTNDSLYVLANGLAGNPEITPGSPDFAAFQSALQAVVIHLAKQIAKDGEGATKLLEVQVVGADSVEEARRAARSVCGSALVKTAMFCEDANWGRIMCALGYSGAHLEQDKVDLWVGPMQMLKAGTPVPFSEEEAARILAVREITVKADLHLGAGAATAWGCDFSYDYVKINGDYRT